MFGSSEELRFLRFLRFIDTVRAIKKKKELTKKTLIYFEKSCNLCYLLLYLDFQFFSREIVVVGMANVQVRIQYACFGHLERATAVGLMKHLDLDCLIKTSFFFSYIFFSQISFFNLSEWSIVQSRLVMVLSDGSFLMVVICFF